MDDIVITNWKDIQRLCVIYENLRNEQRRGTIAFNSEETFYEHVRFTYKSIKV